MQMRVSQVELAAKETPSDFAEIIRRHQRAVFAVAYSKLGNSHDAEDVAQEVFLEACRNAQKMETPEKMLAWLFRTTTYRCTDHLRKMSRRRRREIGSANSARIDTPADTLDEKERQAAILKAVDSLPAKFRLVVMLRYFAQYSYADISEMTGLTKGAIDGRLRSATKKLRNHLLRMGIGVS